MISTPRDASTTGRANPLQQLSLAQLRQRTSRKWQTYPDDVLPLWIAEMDVPIAEPVARAITDAVSLGDTGYPVGTEYAEALVEFARDRWGWRDLSVDRTTLLPDVMLGIVEVLKVISDPGDPVVVNCPVYPPFYQFIANSGRTVVESRLGTDGRIDFDQLEATFAHVSHRGNRPIFLLCSPHNPTGTVHTATELTQVAGLARHYGVRVVADEIHAPIVSHGTSFVPYLCVSGSETGFSLLSASKAWNLPGLKAALAVAGPDAVYDLERLPEEADHGASHVGVVAHTAALRAGTGWLDAVLDGLDTNRAVLARELAEHLPDVRYEPASGTFLAWLDCRELPLSEEPAQAFLQRGRVALNPGTDFGTGGAGFVRLNLATSTERVSEAVRRMAAAVP